ncbi:hypothetical protein CPR19088_GLDEOEPO_00694 [Companilactobacillus paralimentarius]
MKVNRMSKNEVRDRLLNIDTGFEKAGKDDGDYTIDNFSSFLYTKKEFPTNKDIKNHIKDSFNPMSINKKIEGEENKGFFSKNDLEFSNDFFDDSDFNNKFMFVGLNAAERVGKSDYSEWKNFHDIKKPTNTYRLYIQTNNDMFKGCYITDIIKSFTESDSGHVMRNFFIGDDFSFLKDKKVTSETEIKAKRIEKLAMSQFKDEASNVRKFFSGIINKAKNDGKDCISDYDSKYKFEVASVESLNNIINENQNILNKSMDCFIQECLAVKPDYLIVFGKDAELILKEMSESSLFKENVGKRITEMKRDKKPFEIDDKDINLKYVMDLISSPIEVTHYSTQSVPNSDPNEKSSRSYKFKNWFEYAPDELTTKINELEKKRN